MGACRGRSEMAKLYIYSGAAHLIPRFIPRAADMVVHRSIVIDDSF